MQNNEENINIPELTMGVRNIASLRACKDHADAVYFSLDRLSLRARAQDIKPDMLAEFVEEVHEYGLKGYLTVNSVIYPDDIQELNNVLETAVSAEADAIIAWDPAAIKRAADHDLKVHISTQANVSNHETANFYKSIGASRVVLARELSLEQIKEIRQGTDIELEVFVHGAMCQSVSGRCYLSAYLLGKSANCGECSQPCRWEWTLHSDNGAKVDIDGKYLISAKDLCMIEHIPELAEAGINAFKVEGRLKNPGYTSRISKCYRQAIDDYRISTFNAEKATILKEEMSKEYNRGFSTGFYFGHPGPDGLAADDDKNAAPATRQAVGVILNYFSKNSAASVRLMEQGISVGDKIIIEGSTTYIEQKVRSLIFEGATTTSAKQGQEVGIGVEGKVRKNDRMFKINEISDIEKSTK